jgi:hypothetical protein
MENFLNVKNREPTLFLRRGQQEGDGRVGQCRLRWGTSEPHVREAREGQAGPAVRFRPKAKMVNVSSFFHTFL